MVFTPWFFVGDKSKVSFLRLNKCDNYVRFLEDLRSFYLKIKMQNSK